MSISTCADCRDWERRWLEASLASFHHCEVGQCEHPPTVWARNQLGGLSSVCRACAEHRGWAVSSAYTDEAERLTVWTRAKELGLASCRYCGDVSEGCDP